MEIRNTTTLDELISHSPELEGFLETFVPGYTDVKQIPLKASVRKILTVERMALMKQTDVAAFVRLLQEKTGDLPADEPEKSIEFEASDPEWIKGVPLKVIDGVEMLNRGEHPVGSIGQMMQNAPKGEFVLLTTNFSPQPLIDAMQQQGYEVYSREDLLRKGLFLTFILKG
ncbi:MAG: hypothetical protein GXO76_01770 [Calditrichaeota bacterium]|nr:hypothetical protein [Calditrichota bacterium]